MENRLDPEHQRQGDHKEYVDKSYLPINHHQELTGLIYLEDSIFAILCMASRLRRYRLSLRNTRTLSKDFPG